MFSQLFPLAVYKEQFTPEEVQSVQKLHKAFLQDFKIRELQEIDVICQFLAVMVDYASASDGVVGSVSMPRYAMMAAGPSTILKLYEIHNTDIVLVPLQGPWGTPDTLEEAYWDNPLKGYLYEPLHAILEAQQANLSRREQKTVILDSSKDWPKGCDHCQGKSSLHCHFWNKDNWSLLKYGFDDFGTLRYPERFLKGLLPKNSTDWPFYASIFDKNFDYARFMHGLFEVKLELFAEWKPEDWLCSACVAIFISGNLNKLLSKLYRETWQKPGDSQRSNCSEGYNCKLQTMDSGHVKRWNHFHEPERAIPLRVQSRSNRDILAFLDEWDEGLDPEDE
ncbi:hypothetical protein BDN72DRAFT_893840 [Pluteus cervinus]|uniref:Uncharacterized protein n=1 Tax=Pluteus cervinus TaxID=181527 RepID=A0ACD3B6F4_9AGAR|nr:hypothetical protein BDN72DRAFT_893840 [Pluteus cervinus]